MKSMALRAFSFLTLAFFAAIPAIQAADTNPPPRLTVELRDGSRVVGDSVEKYFKFHSALLGNLKFAVKDIRSVECISSNSAKLATASGDSLTVSFVDADFAIKTSFGKVELAAASIQNIHVSCSAGNGFRHALKFNLANRVEIPNGPAMQFGDSPFTISLWFKTDSERPYLSFISKRANSLGDGWVVHQDHGQLLFYCAGCASPKSQPVSIRDNNWHHLLVARAGNLITFYLDGKNVGSGETRCNHYDNNPIRIGMDGDGNSWHFEGEISEVHIYGRALNRDEVQEEWNNGVEQAKAVAGDSLIAGYHFDEGGGNVAKDFSGNNHDGTLMNNPQWEN
jgi:hypothetical protein